MLASVLKKVEAEFIRTGGIKEAMSQARRQVRGLRPVGLRPAGTGKAKQEVLRPSRPL